MFKYILAAALVAAALATTGCTDNSTDNYRVQRVGAHRVQLYTIAAGVYADSSASILLLRHPADGELYEVPECFWPAFEFEADSAEMCPDGTLVSLPAYATATIQQEWTSNTPDVCTQRNWVYMELP